MLIVDKLLSYLTKGGNKVIIIVTTIMAVLFGLYGTLMLWDAFRTEINAFASYDLLKYRPNIEEDEPPYLDDLVKINPDTAGWVTIYGTNIDYPVVKGKDDKEYLNKDALGKYSVSGSIFMSCLNSKDFSDPYTLIYGHHMDNGSMFGDLDKFRDDEDFFYNKNNKRFEKGEEGVLIMQDRVWNLKVLAIVETSAYDHTIYRSKKKQEEISSLVEYIQQKAKYKRDVGEVDKILALSTCMSATSYDRTVLICKMEVRTDPLPLREKEPLTTHRKAVGHPMAGAYWSLVNAVILLCGLYLCVQAALKRFGRRIVLSEIGITVLMLILFILTQNVRKPMQATDVWTPVMLLCFVAMVFLLRRAWMRQNKEDTALQNNGK